MVGPEAASLQNHCKYSCRSTRLRLFVGFIIYLQLCMSLAVMDFTDLWWGVGQGSHTICFGHPEHLLEKHHSLSVDMEKPHQMSACFLTWKPNESCETKGWSIPDTIEIRPLLPGETGFLQRCFKFRPVSNITIATSENLFQINSCWTWL